MKLSVNRHEKKGPFGGTYYETEIKVTLEPEEREVARKMRGLMDKTLIGGEPDSVEGDKVFRLFVKGVKESGRVTMNDLSNGVVAKADGDGELSRLAWFENSVRERCKKFKEIIENTVHSKSRMNQSFEEEI